MNDTSSLEALLIVRDAAQAIDFYQRALGAQLIVRYQHGPERRISHADLALGAARFALTEELPAWNSEAPTSLGGSPVVLQLAVADADAVVRCMTAAGADLLYPLQPFAGELMARVRDPFGHLWIVRQLLEALAPEEIQRRRDELFAQLSELTPVAPKNSVSLENAPTLAQAPNPLPALEACAPRVHLVIGPVGAGKSTFAQRFAREHGAIHLNLDAWMTTLFRPDRPATGLIPWYRERAQRCIDEIWALARDLVARGTPSILEIGLLQRREREPIYQRFADAGLPLTIHVIDAARDIRRDRVLQRNLQRGPTFSMAVPPDIFELASDLWQAPDGNECDGRDVRFLWTDAERVEPD